MPEPTRPMRDRHRDTPDVKVSVCVLGYNQRAELRAALESVVTQRTDFPFEVIVCDDGSSDGSAEVALEYAERYPALVRAVCRPGNVGPYVNYYEAHNLARGEYVAHLDGDDLFLPDKLQRQADYLDAHPDVSVLWHAVRLIDTDGHRVGRISLRDALAPDGNFRLEDALELGSIGVHSSTMYRAAARTTRRPSVEPIDWFYAVEFLAHGRGHQLAEELGAYRRTGTSMSYEPASMQSVRRRFARMVLHYVARFPEHRRELFTLSLLLTLADLRAGLGSFRAMLGPLWATRCLVSPRRLRRALRRFRAANRAFEGALPPAGSARGRAG